MCTKKLTDLKVNFLYGDSGYCRDIFRTTMGYNICRLQRKYNGQEHIGWYALSGEDEPDCPIKTTLPIHIIGKNNSIVITEQNRKVENDFYGEKKFPFSWERNRIEDTEIIKLYDDIYQS